MLIDQDTNDVIEILEDNSVLKDSVQEAIELIGSAQ
jgi:hypothetical protein